MVAKHRNREGGGAALYYRSTLNVINRTDLDPAEVEAVCLEIIKPKSKSMETEGIKRIFARSETTRQLQYTEYFGDGDSKAYSEIEHVYDNVQVEKKECVCHVQKRVGTALRKLKKENKGIGGQGKLTDSLIDKIQNYYGIAIRSNCGDLN